MTRKDFELIARTIKREYASEEVARIRVATTFARALEGTNAGFDVVRFLKACGVTP